MSGDKHLVTPVKGNTGAASKETYDAGDVYNEAKSLWSTMVDVQNNLRTWKVLAEKCTIKIATDPDNSQPAQDWVNLYDQLLRDDGPMEKANKDIRFVKDYLQEIPERVQRQAPAPSRGGGSAGTEAWGFVDWNNEMIELHDTIRPKVQKLVSWVSLKVINDKFRAAFDNLNLTAAPAAAPSGAGQGLYVHFT